MKPMYVFIAIAVILIAFLWYKKKATTVIAAATVPPPAAVPATNAQGTSLTPVIDPVQQVHSVSAVALDTTSLPTSSINMAQYEGMHISDGKTQWIIKNGLKYYLSLADWQARNYDPYTSVDPSIVSQMPNGGNFADLTPSA